MPAARAAAAVLRIVSDREGAPPAHVTLTYIAHLDEFGHIGP